jgi:hypothetical protein
MAGFTLTNVATADYFNDDTTVVGVSLAQFTLIVTGAAVYYQLGAGGNFNTPERLLPPGFHTRHRPQYDSLRVRSAKAGVPAKVSLEF